MKMLPAFLFGVLCVVVLGCGSLGLPTDQAPGWVKAMDELTKVKAELVKPPNGPPVVQVTKEPNPLENVPYAGTAIALLGVLWYKIRQSAAAHSKTLDVLDRTADALANSVPAPPQPPRT